MSQEDKQILSAFLQASLSEKGWQLDEPSLAMLSDTVQLTPAESDLSEETRQVTIKEDSSGKVSAASFKLWNVAQISIHDWLKLVGDGVQLLVFEGTTKKIIFGLAMLIHEFYPKLKVTFTDQEAQVLFVIAQLKQKAFTTEELFPVFEEAFSSSLTETQMEASLEVLVQHRVIERTAIKAYKVREKIKNLKRLK